MDKWLDAWSMVGWLVNDQLDKQPAIKITSRSVDIQIMRNYILTLNIPDGFIAELFWLSILPATLIG